MGGELQRPHLGKGTKGTIVPLPGGQPVQRGLPRPVLANFAGTGCMEQVQEGGWVLVPLLPPDTSLSWTQSALPSPATSLSRPSLAQLSPTPRPLSGIPWWVPGAPAAAVVVATAIRQAACAELGRQRPKGAEGWQQSREGSRQSSCAGWRRANVCAARAVPRPQKA